MSHSVELSVYNISSSFSRSMLIPIFGRQIEGYWHTGVSVFGKEYFYGLGHGIIHAKPGSMTCLGELKEVVKIGKTNISPEELEKHLNILRQTTFEESKYLLLKHNCNNFSEALCQYLCNASIPEYILDFQRDFVSSPLGFMLQPIVEKVYKIKESS